MKNKTNISPEAKTKRILIISLSIFLSAVLLFGGVIGIAAVVRTARAVVSYRGVTMDEGVVNYLSATYKMVFLRDFGIGGQVYSGFWDEASSEDSDLTWGDVLRKNTESYIKSIAVRSYLYDRAGSLSAADKATLEEIREEILKRVGTVSEFNRLAEPMGFNYSDFKDAAELIYKANRAISAIYGSDGRALASESYYGVCNEYFESSYSRVRLLFIRTETEFSVDEDGNRIVGFDGRDELRELTDEEKAERQNDVENIRGAISALASGGNRQMSPEYFDTFLSKYGYYPEYAKSGFYLSPYSAFTKEFGSGESGLAAVVERSLTMNDGEYGEVECDFGICFIYKLKKTDYAYLDSTLDAFFSDFYARAAENMFSESMAELSLDAKIKDEFYKIDLENLAYN